MLLSTKHSVIHISVCVACRRVMTCTSMLVKSVTYAKALTLRMNDDGYGM